MNKLIPPNALHTGVALVKEIGVDSPNVAQVALGVYATAIFHLVEICNLEPLERDLLFLKAGALLSVHWPSLAGETLEALAEASPTPVTLIREAIEDLHQQYDDEVFS